MIIESVREESSSNTGRNNSGGPVARRKKTDFEDISEFGVQLPPPTTTWKSPCQAESPSTGSGNSSNPAVRR